MPKRLRPEARLKPTVSQTARIVFVTFLLTFICARVTVYLILIQKLPNIFTVFEGAHVHHLSYGIIVLSVVAGFLLFRRPSGIEARFAAAAYGVGLGLTYDEFGMWLHLQDNYWQRTSWDAVGVVAALFGLVAFAPSIKKFRFRHWLLSAVIVAVVVIFFYMLFTSRG